MIYIKIITPTPGLKTKEKLLQIIEDRNTGIMIKELSQQVNRPVSMLQVYLKQLVISKKICVIQSKVSKNLIYYPSNNVDKNYLPTFGNFSKTASICDRLKQASEAVHAYN